MLVTCSAAYRGSAPPPLTPMASPRAAPFLGQRFFPSCASNGRRVQSVRFRRPHLHLPVHPSLGRCTPLHRPLLGRGGGSILMALMMLRPSLVAVCCGRGRSWASRGGSVVLGVTMYCGLVCLRMLLGIGDIAEVGAKMEYTTREETFLP